MGIHEAHCNAKSHAHTSHYWNAAEPGTCFGFFSRTLLYVYLTAAHIQNRIIPEDKRDRCKSQSHEAAQRSTPSPLETPIRAGMPKRQLNIYILLSPEASETFNVSSTLCYVKVDFTVAWNFEKDAAVSERPSWSGHARSCFCLILNKKNCRYSV